MNNLKILGVTACFSVGVLFGYKLNNYFQNKKNEDIIVPSIALRKKNNIKQEINDLSEDEEETDDKSIEKEEIDDSSEDKEEINYKKLVKIYIDFENVSNIILLVIKLNAYIQGIQSNKYNQKNECILNIHFYNKWNEKTKKNIINNLIPKLQNKKMFIKYNFININKNLKNALDFTLCFDVINNMIKDKKNNIYKHIILSNDRDFLNLKNWIIKNKINGKIEIKKCKIKKQELTEYTKFISRNKNRDNKFKHLIQQL